MGLSTADIKYRITFRKKQQKLLNQSIKEEMTIKEFFEKEQIGLAIAKELIEFIQDNPNNKYEIIFPESVSTH